MSCSTTYQRVGKVLGNLPPVAVAVFNALSEVGGRPYIVGGFVRDSLLGLPPKDLDVEVFDLPLDCLVETLRLFGDVDLVGLSFGVVKLRTRDGQEFDFTLPRRESKTGQGHKAFLVEPDPAMTPREAAARRDFTMNALMLDPLDNTLLDFFGGVQDITNRRLRHTSPAFAEDPLRVLRGMQFAARFGLTAAPETVEICRALLGEYGSLARERIWGEWEKWAVKGVRPSAGLRFLRAVGWDALYPELKALQHTPQSQTYHPEGDAWEHTCHVVDAAARIAARDGLKGDDKAVLLLSALLHDVGKPQTTTRRGGRWVSAGHAQAGEEIARRFLERINTPRRIAERVLPLVREHMAIAGSGPTPRAVRRLSDRLHPATVEEWARLVEADHSGRPPRPATMPAYARRALDLARRLQVDRQRPKPILMGRHLLNRGLMQPGPEMGEVLRAAYKAQLDGEFSDLAGALRWAESFIGGDRAKP